ncbi:MAG: hypothetical protein K6G26_04005 [Lachnospiraceae bacterium]|nr:hypothetical protein [Lachnospiraceae bacterium]
MENEFNSLLSDSRNCFKECKKNWELIVVAAMVGILIGFLASLDFGTDTYKATTVISSSAYGDYSVTESSTKAMLNYSSFIKTSLVLNRAMAMLDYDLTQEDLEDMITIDPSAMVTLKISAVSENPEEAMDVANAVSEAFVVEACNRLGDNVVSVLDHADEEDVKRERNGALTQWLIRIICGIACAILFAAVLMIRRLSSKKIVYIEDFTCAGEVEIIGIVPKFDNEKDREFI